MSKATQNPPPDVESIERCWLKSPPSDFTDLLWFFIYFVVSVVSVVSVLLIVSLVIGWMIAALFFYF